MDPLFAYQDLYNESVINIDVANVGTIDAQNINAQNINVSSLTPNFPVKTDSGDNLISSKIDLTNDVAGVLTLRELSNQMIVQPGGLGNAYTMTYINPGQATTLKTPDPGVASSNYVLTDTLATQTINSVVDFANSVEFGALVQNAVVFLNSFKNIVAAQLTNGQLLIGSTGAAPVQGVITSSTLSVTNGAGTINIEVSTTPSYTTLTLTNNTNQLIFSHSGTFSTIINVLTPAANSTYRVPDVGTTADFVMTSGSQSISGTKTFNSGIFSNITVLGNINDNLLAKASTLGGTLNLLLAPTTQNLTYGFPDVTTSGGSASLGLVVMTEGDNVLKGKQTIYNTLALNGANPQLTIQPNALGGNLNIYSFIFTVPSASYSITFPNPGTSTSFILANAPSQIINITTNQFFTLAGDNSAGTQLVVGNAAQTKSLTIGYDTTNDGAKIDAYNNVSYATSSIAIGSLGEIVQIGGFFAAPVSRAVGQFIVYGSNTTDNADVLKIRQKTNTFPYEMFMGMNVTAGYGVIQCTRQGVSYNDTYLSPLGGNVRIGGGLKLPNPSTGAVTLLSDYSEENTSYSWSGPYAALSATLQFTRVGRSVTIIIPSLTKAGNSTASAITNSVAFPARYIPPFNLNWETTVLDSNGNNITGQIVLNTSGTMSIFRTVVTSTVTVAALGTPTNVTVTTQQYQNFPSTTAVIGLNATSVHYSV